MGMFNSIYADLLCPLKKKNGKNTEIQIKWQEYSARVLAHYRVGDILENIEKEYDNAWIRTDYICEVCSKHTQGREWAYIKTEYQERHFVFVNVQKGQLKEILTEEEFLKRRIKDFVKYD